MGAKRKNSVNCDFLNLNLYSYKYATENSQLKNLQLKKLQFTDFFFRPHTNQAHGWHPTLPQFSSKKNAICLQV